MAKAKRTLSEFNFEGEGASVALVSKDQGGPANGIPTLITKATKTNTAQENIKQAISKSTVSVEMSIIEFLCNYLDCYWDDAEIIATLMGFSPEEINSYWAGDLDSTTSYLEARLDKITVNKSATAQQFLEKFAAYKETVELLKKSNEVPKPENLKGVKDNMPEANNINIQEEITKALKDREAELRAEVEKSFQKDQDKLRAELNVLKSLEEDRQNAVFKAQAESVKEALGDAVDVEVLTKALRTANSAEDTKPLVALVKSLCDFNKPDETLVEKGANSGKEPENTSEDAKVEALAKSFQEADPTMPSFTAYTKAYEQIHGLA